MLYMAPHLLLKDSNHRKTDAHDIVGKTQSLPHKSRPINCFGA